MEIVKSNMNNLEPFQLLYCGTTGMASEYAPITVYGIPRANMFTLYVDVSSTGAHHFSLNKNTTPKWTASILKTT